MKLYYSPGACSLASHIALIEGDADYDKVRVDLKKHRTEHGTDFYSISPRGYVPAIETDGMGLITENPAVLPYIAQQTGRLPQGEEMFRLLEWIGFVGTEIHTGYGALFGGAPDDEQAEARDALADVYDLTDELMDGRDWLVGDGPSVADNYLFVTLLWADKFGVEVPDALAAYRTRNLERPAVKQAMQEEGLG